MNIQRYQLRIHSLVYAESGNLCRTIIPHHQNNTLPKLHKRTTILETAGKTSQDSFSFFFPHSYAFHLPAVCCPEAVRQAVYQVKSLAAEAFNALTVGC